MHSETQPFFGCLNILMRRSCSSQVSPENRSHGMYTEEEKGFIESFDPLIITTEKSCGK